MVSEIGILGRCYGGQSGAAGESAECAKFRQDVAEATDFPSPISGRLSLALSRRDFNDIGSFSTLADFDLAWKWGRK